MKNPFLNFQQYESKPPRNSVDLSFRSNGTFSFGTLYPVFCKEVNEGDTFSIETAFGLKFLPMPFPVQTPMRATMHYFYVRNRTIWKDWEDFIYGNKSADVVPHPYIYRSNIDKDFWKTGGIADRLGVPTTIVEDGISSVLQAPAFGVNYLNAPVGVLTPLSTSYFPVLNGSTNNNNYALSDPRPFLLNIGGVIPPYPVGALLRNMFVASPAEFVLDNEDALGLGYLYGGFDIFPSVRNVSDEYLFDLNFVGSQIRTAPDENVDPEDQVHVAVFTLPKDDDNLMHCVCEGVLDVVSSSGFTAGSTAVSLTCKVPDDGTGFLLPYYQNRKFYFFVYQTYSQFSKYHVLSRPDTGVIANTTNFIGSSVNVYVPLSDTSDLSNENSPNPFAAVNGGDPALPISALPFRVYESIYNSWYRNERLEPLIIDGVPEYNRYCPNMNSGADTFPYKLYQRNWQADFLTSALPTPQQGIAPVVGVTGLDNISIQDPDTNEIYNFTAEVGDDGETITGGSFHDPDASQSVRRTAVELVTAGFTINDLRNVSALQRWVENNIRRGLKYRDQVLANTGVKVKYDELDMPEFLGGFSRPVNVASVNQTAPGDSGVVGDYAGQASCFGQSKHRISRYCDEKGFIMGILCITPEPVYSQLLPKHFLKRTALDYHHPAFNHIGMQPICYDEVCPLQVYASDPTQAVEGSVKFNDVFGYQRPYYDLLASVDEVHGLMRTSLRNYVMNRTFSDVPELGAEFVHVDPAQLNQVFNITNENQDVVMGEIYFRCFAKRPVSLFGQPKIV